MAVVLIGTLDTKGIEFQYVRDQLKRAGIAPLVIDAGVLGPAHFTPDFSRDQVFAAAGTSLAAVKESGDRGKAVEAAAKGVTRIVQDLFAASRVDGIMSLGGSAGTTIGTAAMRSLPFGIPKLMVSTLASGQVQPYV